MTTKQPSTPMDIVSLLQICRDIETYCAQIYRVYSERYSDDEELQNLWKKTYEEEENHAKQFVMAINMRRDGVVVDMNIDTVKATQVLEMVKSIYNGILTNLPSKIDALRSAIKIEEKLSTFHLDAIAVFQDEGMQKMFRAMMKADQHHLQRINEMYKNRLIV